MVNDWIMGLSLPISSAADPREISERVSERCIENLFNTNNSAVLGTLVVASLFSWVVWDWVSHINLAIWLSMISTVATTRFLFGMKFKKQRFKNRSSAWWARRFNGIIYCSCTTWALGIWFLYPRNAITEQALLMVLIAGISAVSVQTLNWSRPALLSTIAAVLSPLCLRTFMETGTAHLIMGLMVVFFFFLMMRLALATNGVQLESLRLQEENISLISDLSQSNQQTKQLNRHLQEEIAAKEIITRELTISNAAKSTFLSRMSHELRTPMNAILGFAQILKVDLDTSTTARNTAHHQYLNEIMKAGDHLLTLINEVLDLSKIEAGKAEVNMELVDTVEVVRQSIAMITAMAVAKGIAIDSDLPAQAPLIKADPTRLRQVLINLTSNAIKYNTPDGNVHIGMTEHEGDMLRITVRDTGFGIEEEMLPRLFKPFERGVDDYSSIQGTGIGLTITKQLVELMEGEIGFSTVPGEGSEFWVAFPIIKRSDNKDAGTAQKDSALFLVDTPAIKPDQQASTG